MGESLKLWKCTSCNRVLRERDVAYARARHQAMIAEATPASAASFVEEATWGAYLASLRRCRCGRKRFEAVSRQSLRGQLDLSLAFDALVLQ
jgi:hypothetical protein